MTEYANLGDLRTRMLGMSPAFVAREARIAADRLAAIEAGAPPSVAEIERLADVYGLDADLLEDEPITVSRKDTVHALALRSEFRAVSALTKRRALAAASAARDVVELRALLHRGRGYDQLLARTRPRPPARDKPPFAQGAHWAHEWRKLLKAGQAPIPSARDLVRSAFPEVAVLVTDLGDETISGMSFAAPARGPAIVLNAQGKNTNPLVRRFSLLHELGHLLMDAQRGEPLAGISGFLSDHQLDVEQRANAFAVRFLCPERELKSLARSEKRDPIGRLVERWGVHAAAARLYLDKVAGVELPEAPSDMHLVSSVSPKWSEAEDWGLDRFPLDEVPLERRTDVALLAAQAYSRGKVGRDRYARYLGVTPAEPVERVLDYYSLDLPDAA